MRFADPISSNYKRIMMDKVFQQSIVNTFLYLIIQVPICLLYTSDFHVITKYITRNRVNSNSNSGDAA